MTILSYGQQRNNMIHGQIRIAGVSEPRLLEAFQAIPREDFMPDPYRHMAYMDKNLAIGEGRFFIAPANYARLVQAINIQPDTRVLDIGCLSGYSTAILGSLSSHVCGVDDQKWIMVAKHVAESTGLAMQDFYIGALTDGAEERAPFDVIIINGAIQYVPQILVDQLAEGGVIACFWRQGKRHAGQGTGQAVLHRKHGNLLHTQILFDASVPVLPGFEQEKGFVF